MSFCPACGHQQFCPCKSCRKEEAPKWCHCEFCEDAKKPWKWIDGELISCSQCGFTQHVDWWEEMDYAIYEGSGDAALAFGDGGSHSDK